MDVADSGNGTGAVGCPCSHPHVANTATQTTAHLKGFTFAPVVKVLLAATSINRATPLRAATSRGRFAAKTWHGNSGFAKILLLAGYFSSKA
jgi:hypothetical protein